MQANIKINASKYQTLTIFEQNSAEMLKIFTNKTKESCLKK